MCDDEDDDEDGNDGNDRKGQVLLWLILDSKDVSKIPNSRTTEQIKAINERVI